MKHKPILTIISLLVVIIANAQNVGIGTITPKASFNVAAGQTVLFGSDSISIGNKLMWLPVKGTFRAGFYLGSTNDTIGLYSTAMGNSSANGQYSAAMGNSFSNGQYSTAIGNSHANGQYSTAMGSSYASGYGSTAMSSGYANGFSSTAMGNSRANADYSTSMGNGTYANSVNETVIGTNNDTSNTNRLFEIGDGTIATHSNALTVLNNGMIGIGTTNPNTPFNVAAGETVLFGSDITSFGSKMMWLPDKGAFRAGNYTGSTNDAIGLNSTAMGYSTANGQFSTAMGESGANGQFSTAMGNGLASGDYSTALGTGSAKGYGSTALGGGYTTGNYSTAMGYGTYAKSGNETVIGTYNDTSNTNRLFEIGDGTFSPLHNALTVLNNGMVGIGTVNPNALLEVDYASSTTSPQLLLNQLGTSSAYSRLSFQNTLGKSWTFAVTRNSSSASDVINFYDEQIGANRFTFFGNGNATFAGTLTQNSDERLKINIHSINNVLPLLNAINAYTYNWKEENRGKDEQIGFLAQEIEKVYPQLVRTDDNGIKSVAYQNMVPILLQAIKEQQQEFEEQNRSLQQQFEEQQQENKALQQQIDELKKLIKTKD